VAPGVVGHEHPEDHVALGRAATQNGLGKGTWLFSGSSGRPASPMSGPTHND
jgi:hypothetical protein